MASQGDLKDSVYFFDEFVLPNYQEFLKDQLSVRKAYNAAIAISHVPDYVGIERGGSRGAVGSLRKDFCKSCRPFKVVEGMSNAIKHFSTRAADISDRIHAMAGSLKSVDNDYVVFSGELDGEAIDYRSDHDLLMFEFREGKRSSRQPVGWMLYFAIRFVARELGVEGRLGPRDQPEQLLLRYRRQA